MKYIQQGGVKGGVTISSYRYDGLGRRIKKNELGTRLQYIHENADIGADTILEFITFQQPSKIYTNGPGIDDPIIYKENWQFYYVLKDGLNSVTEVVNSGGSVINSYVYESFGKIAYKTETVTNPRTYTARELELNGLILNK